MSIKDRYLAYAEAFEQTYVDDDWNRIGPYFTEDAVYEGGPEVARGREAVLAALKGSVNSMDRNMDSRTPEFAAPTVDGNSLSMDWTVTYSKSGCPDLKISGREFAEFKGDQIALLRDEFSPEAQQAMESWMSEHGHKLAPGGA